MPKPSEICEVNAGGTKYKYWKEVEVTRDFSQVTSEARLIVAEISDLKSWDSLKLQPGDDVNVTMAGQRAMTGYVIVRQVAYAAQNHNVRFVIQSKPGALVHGTVDRPGQMKNKTLVQANNILTGPFGIQFSLKGVADGADKIFERINVHIGESPMQCMLRLCLMRNIHLIDDAFGNLIGIRGPQQVVAQLQEGRNILSAEMIWRDDVASDKHRFAASAIRNDQTHADTAETTAEANNPLTKNKRLQEHTGPMPSDKKDAQMGVNHYVDLDVAEMLDCNITIQGWLRDNGELWMNNVGDAVTLYSPMLFPQKSVTLWIQAVTHRQGEGGTTTQLNLTTHRLLIGADRHSFGPGGKGPSVPEAAT